MSLQREAILSALQGQQPRGEPRRASVRFTAARASFAFVLLACSIFAVNISAIDTSFASILARGQPLATGIALSGEPATLQPGATAQLNGTSSNAWILLPSGGSSVVRIQSGAALQLSGLGVALGSAPPTPSPDQPPAWGPDVLLSLLSFFQPAPEDSGGSGSNSNSGSGSGSSGSSGGVLELRNVVVDVGGGWGQEGGAGPANGICSSLVWIRHAACAAMPDFNLQVSPDGTVRVLQLSSPLLVATNVTLQCGGSTPSPDTTTSNSTGSSSTSNNNGSSTSSNSDQQAVQGPDYLECVSFFVADGTDLARAIARLDMPRGQALGRLVILLEANVTAPSGYMRQGSMTITNTTVIAGRPGVPTQFDLQGITGVAVLPASSDYNRLELVDLWLANLPLGPPAQQPGALLAAGFWFADFARQPLGALELPLRVSATRVKFAVSDDEAWYWRGMVSRALAAGSPGIDNQIQAYDPGLAVLPAGTVQVPYWEWSYGSMTWTDCVITSTPLLNQSVSFIQTLPGVLSSLVPYGTPGGGPVQLSDVRLSTLQLDPAVLSSSTVVILRGDNLLAPAQYGAAANVTVGTNMTLWGDAGSLLSRTLAMQGVSGGITIPPYTVLRMNRMSLMNLGVGGSAVQPAALRNFTLMFWAFRRTLLPALAEEEEGVGQVEGEEQQAGGGDAVQMAPVLGSDPGAGGVLQGPGDENSTAEADSMFGVAGGGVSEEVSGGGSGVRRRRGLMQRGTAVGAGGGGGVAAGRRGRALQQGAHECGGGRGPGRVLQRGPDGGGEEAGRHGRALQQGADGGQAGADAASLAAGRWRPWLQLSDVDVAVPPVELQLVRELLVSNGSSTTLRVAPEAVAFWREVLAGAQGKVLTTDNLYFDWLSWAGVEATRVYLSSGGGRAYPVLQPAGSILVPDSPPPPPPVQSPPRPPPPSPFRPPSGNGTAGGDIGGTANSSPPPGTSPPPPAVVTPVVTAAAAAPTGPQTVALVGAAVGGAVGGAAVLGLGLAAYVLVKRRRSGGGTRAGVGGKGDAGGGAGVGGGSGQVLAPGGGQPLLATHGERSGAVAVAAAAGNGDGDGNGAVAAVGNGPPRMGSSPRSAAAAAAADALPFGAAAVASSLSSPRVSSRAVRGEIEPLTDVQEEEEADGSGVASGSGAAAGASTSASASGTGSPYVSGAGSSGAARGSAAAEHLRRGRSRSRADGGHRPSNGSASSAPASAASGGGSGRTARASSSSTVSSRSGGAASGSASGSAASGSASGSAAAAASLVGDGGPADPRTELYAALASFQSELGEQQQQITISTQLGAGAHGVVYKGEWRGLEVAVKTLLFQAFVGPGQGADLGKGAGFKEQAMLEAAIATTLYHPNVINTYAYDIRPLRMCPVPTGGGGGGTGSGGAGGSGAGGSDSLAASEGGGVMDWKLYIIQEYCDGGTLKDALDDGRFADPSADPASGAPGGSLITALRVALEIACGMTYIHNRSIIHGDLKPANILLRSDSASPYGYTAKVADFGLALKLKAGETHISNIRRGTPFYIASELVEDGRATTASDLYSFGVMLWELLHGCTVARRLPLRRRIPNLPSEFYTWPSDPAHCPPAYRELGVACLSSSPQQRPRFSDAVDTLARILRELTAPPPSRTSSSGRSRKLAASADGSSRSAALAAGGGAGVVGSSGSGRARGAAAAAAAGGAGGGVVVPPMALFAGGGVGGGGAARPGRQDSADDRGVAVGGVKGPDRDSQSAAAVQAAKTALLRGAVLPPVGTAAAAPQQQHPPQQSTPRARPSLDSGTAADAAPSQTPAHQPPQPPPQQQQQQQSGAQAAQQQKDQPHSDEPNYSESVSWDFRVPLRGTREIASKPAQQRPPPPPPPSGGAVAVRATALGDAGAVLEAVGYTPTAAGMAVAVRPSRLQHAVQHEPDRREMPRGGGGGGGGPPGFLPLPPSAAPEPAALPPDPTPGDSANGGRLNSNVRPTFAAESLPPLHGQEQPQGQEQEELAAAPSWLSASVRVAAVAALGVSSSSPLLSPGGRGPSLPGAGDACGGVTRSNSASGSNALGGADASGQPHSTVPALAPA